MKLHFFGKFPLGAFAASPVTEPLDESAHEYSLRRFKDLSDRGDPVFELLMRGSQLLAAGSRQHVVTCLFDFRDLLGTQRCRRVDTQRAACGNVRRRHRDNKKKQCDARKCHEIYRRHLEE